MLGDEAQVAEWTQALATGCDAPLAKAQALVALGYNDREASAACKALPSGVGVSDGIKLALKSLAH